MKKTFLEAGMKVSVACCDDEKEQILYYKELFATYEIRHEIDLEVDYFLSGEFCIHSVQSGKIFDVVFLDMEMPNKSGLEVAREIRKYRGKETKIIFLTSYAKYMQDSFDVRAFHYIIKPVGYDEFERKFQDALNELIKDEDNICVLQTDKDDIVVRIKDILYIEKEKSNKYVSVHLREGTLSIKDSLLVLERKLEEKHFLRIHRSVLVNMRYIKRIRKAEVVLSNGVTIPVSRRKEGLLKNYFMKYAITER